MDPVMYMKNIWSGESWLLSDTSAPSLYSESKTFLFLKSIVWKMNVSTIGYFLLFDVFSSPEAHLLHNINTNNMLLLVFVPICQSLHVGTTSLLTCNDFRFRWMHWFLVIKLHKIASSMEID